MKEEQFPEEFNKINQQVAWKKVEDAWNMAEGRTPEEQKMIKSFALDELWKWMKCGLVAGRMLKDGTAVISQLAQTKQNVSNVRSSRQCILSSEGRITMTVWWTKKVFTECDCRKSQSAPVSSSQL